MNIYIALIHHPIRNRRGETVTTGVTNVDIHDLARSARSFGVSGYYLVTPVTQQRALVERIAAHWREGAGAEHNPVRAQAFQGVRVRAALEEVVDDITRREEAAPLVAATGAAIARPTTTYETLRLRLAREGGALLLLFGTGWGLVDEVLQRADLLLPPVRAVAGRDGYNHLSVRAAAAIILDRLLGDRDAPCQGERPS